MFWHVAEVLCEYFILSHRILDRHILKDQDLIKLIFKKLKSKNFNVFLHVVNVFLHEPMMTKTSI